MRWLAAASAVLALALHHPLWAQGSSDSTPVPVSVAKLPSYAPGVPEGESEIGGLLSLGFGYTWRR